jgi:hypothetical protein
LLSTIRSMSHFRHASQQSAPPHTRDVLKISFEDLKKVTTSLISSALLPIGSTLPTQHGWVGPGDTAPISSILRHLKLNINLENQDHPPGSLLLNDMPTTCTGFNDQTTRDHRCALTGTLNSLNADHSPASILSQLAMMMRVAFSVSTPQGPEKFGSFQSAKVILDSLTPPLSLFSFSLSFSDSSLKLLYQAQSHRHGILPHPDPISYVKCSSYIFAKLFQVIASKTINSLLAVIPDTCVAKLKIATRWNEIEICSSVTWSFVVLEDQSLIASSADEQLECSQQLAADLPMHVSQDMCSFTLISLLLILIRSLGTEWNFYDQDQTRAAGPALMLVEGILGGPGFDFAEEINEKDILHQSGRHCTDVPSHCEASGGDLSSVRSGELSSVHL